MLPTGENTTNREAVSRDFYDLDSLIAEINIPKQQIGAAPETGLPTGSPENSAAPQYYPGDEPEPREPISSDVAALAGKTIAGTIDTVIGTSLSLYAKNTEPDKYQAKEKQIGQLENAWQAVAQKYGYTIEDSPWFNVILLTVAVYLPLMQEAKKDRRFAEMDEKIAELQRKHEKLQSSINDLENQNKQTSNQ